jgi:mono/diheme cytochrome c family protein
MLLQALKSSPTNAFHRLLLAALLALGGAASAAADGPEHPGAAIYQKLCAECHGDKGQGVPDKYDEPLHGNRSIASLAKRIERTMPEENVGACVGEDAEQVAAYIYEAFYSPAAVARLRPPEWDLARLTVPQYRTSVADLIGRFRNGSEKIPGAERGLKAHFDGLALDPPVDPNAPPVAPEPPKDKKNEEKKDPSKARFDRVDRQVAFEFGGESPDPKQLKPTEFSGRWEGALLAEETGVYEFIVRSENGFRLFVNDNRKTLIDAWVASGKDVREEKKSIYLIGGRAYPIKLEFFKFKDASASIRLLWKRPLGAVETIPAENLLPDHFKQVMVVSNPFPADDRSDGYERGTGISKEWQAATTEGAIAVAEHVETYLDDLTGTKAGAPDRDEKLRKFARKFVETAFRGPLSDEEAAQLLERAFGSAKTPELAIKRVVLFALKSPRFLYPEFPVDGAPDSYQVAARLANSLWDGLPDQKLLKLASENKLQTREAIAAEAKRMLADPRARAKLHGFFHHWLELERAEMAAKDPQAFPGFDAQVMSDLRTSLERFVDSVVWSERSDYRELLQANYLLLNERLGKLYGKEVKGDEFQRVEFDAKERAGVVTHPYLLSAFASSKATSPIHRGVFLTRTIVGMTLRPPPKAIAFEDAKFEQHMTMREKVTEMTKNESCMGCHATINPLGFSLENYDAIGRWRTKENDKPIDPVGDFSTEEGATIHLPARAIWCSSRRRIPAVIAPSSTTSSTIQVKQAVETYGPDTLETLRQSFASSGFNIRQLLVDMATIAAARDLPGGTPQKLAQKTDSAPSKPPL